MKEEWREYLEELREGNWDVPDDEEAVGPADAGELTDAKAAYKAELLAELQDKKEIKNARLQEKREIEEQIRDLQVRLEAANEALQKARSEVSATVRKLNGL